MTLHECPLSKYFWSKLLTQKPSLRETCLLGLEFSLCNLKPSDSWPGSWRSSADQLLLSKQQGSKAASNLPQYQQLAGQHSAAFDSSFGFFGQDVP